MNAAAVGPGYVETTLTEDYLRRPGVRDGVNSPVPAGRPSYDPTLERRARPALAANS